MLCFKCGKVFRNPEVLTNHLKNDHALNGKSEFDCFKCGKVFQKEKLSDVKDRLDTRNQNNHKKCLPLVDGDEIGVELETAEVHTAEYSAAVDETHVILHGEIVDVDTVGDDAEFFPYDDTVDIDLIERDTVGNEVELDEADNLKMKSLLASWGVSPLYENLIACGINYSTMFDLRSQDLEIVISEDRKLLGCMIKFRQLLEQRNTNSACNKPNLFVDVLIILQQSAEGRIILSDFQNHKLKLDKNLRRELVAIICNETFARGLELSRFTLDDMAKQICNIFTGEKKHVYYQKLRNQDPKGILYQKYVNMRHKQLEEKKKIAKSNKLDLLEEETNDSGGFMEVDSANQCSQDNVEASLKYIRDYTADSNNDLLLGHWKKTFECRQQNFIKYVDIVELFAAWPPLRSETGHALLSIDFVLRYGVQISNGLKNWDSFFNKNLVIIGEMVKDLSMKKVIKGLDSTASSEAKNKVIIMALHHLLVPSATFVNKERWQPTIPMSQESFMRTVNGQHVMMNNMTKREKFCEKYGMRNHPIIFEITTCMGTRYNVCIKDVCYKVESLLEGVDFAYKIFKILNIDFPHECKKVWKFIEHIFYSEDDNISGNLLSIVSDMN